jgi:hypothetical protein
MNWMIHACCTCNGNAGVNHTEPSLVFFRSISLGPGLQRKLHLTDCLVPKLGVARNIIAFRLYLLIIVQTLTN